MDRRVSPWPLPTISGRRDKIDPQPDFQRPAIWGKSQKQLLIDTILRGYDIPKVYWWKVGRDEYKVVDGQQRIRAIWEFVDGRFCLPGNADPVDGENVAGASYATLPTSLRLRFDTYAMDIVIVSDVEQDEVQDMFLRLQNGTPLKAQEKRNAFPGQMRDFVKQLAESRFFLMVPFSNHRFAHDLVAAQLTRLAIAGGPANIKSKDLNEMYQRRHDFDARSAQAKSVQRVLRILSDVFPEKTPELERYNVVALYCVVSEVLENHVIDEVRGGLREWFLDFEKRRAEEEEKSTDDASAEWLAYKDKISHSGDAEESIRFRVDFMLKDLFGFFPYLTRKDNQRAFSHAQRLAIYRKSGGHCQARIVCKGDKLTWSGWHCDHIHPWSQGGKTTVENGQATCAKCNLAKGAELPA